MPGEKIEEATVNNQTQEPTAADQGAGATDPEAQHAAEQQELMADVLDEFEPAQEEEGEPGQKGETQEAETSGEQQAGQTQKKDGESAGGQEETNKQTKKEGQEKSAEATGEQKGATEAKGKKPETEEPLFDVDMPDGARKVGLKQLTTTYQQFANLQRQHADIKPILELARQTGIPTSNLYSYLVYGIQKATQKPKSEEPKEYKGPYESKEVDEYMKDKDPENWKLAHKLFEQAGEATQRVERIERSLTTRDQQVAATGDLKHLVDTLNTFNDDHTEYFSQPGKSREFIEYFKEHYSNVPVRNVSKQFLASVLYAFDPAYVQKSIEARVRQDIEARREEEKKAFGEGGSSTRTGSMTPKLSEQQQHMADMFD